MKRQNTMIDEGILFRTRTVSPLEVAFRAFISIFTFIRYKLMYGHRYASRLVQSWGHGFSVHINGKGALLIIGPKCVSRRFMSVRVENGILSIGSKCFFNSQVDITCTDHITIGDGCQFGQNVVIVDHDHNIRHVGDKPLISSPITIGNNVWIGADCVILRGVTIGDNAVVAAGSVIREDIPADSVVYQKKEDCIVRRPEHADTPV